MINFRIKFFLHFSIDDLSAAVTLNLLVGTLHRKLSKIFHFASSFLRSSSTITDSSKYLSCLLLGIWAVFWSGVEKLLSLTIHSRSQKISPIWYLTLRSRTFLWISAKPSFHFPSRWLVGDNKQRWKSLFQWETFTVPNPCHRRWYGRMSREKEGRPPPPSHPSL